MDDFNIDMFSGLNSRIDNIKNIMSLFSLNQIISLSHLIINNSASLLDLIMLSSSIDTVAENDLMHISDHLTIFAHLTLAASSS